jgi:ATP-dependent DNA helicase RecG
VPNRELHVGDPVIAIDRKVATRRTGWRTKGPEAHDALSRGLGIETVGDLIRHYPRRYIDRSKVKKIGDLKLGSYATVIGTVRKVHKRATRRRQSMVTITIGDGTGYADITFFNQPWLASSYREGAELAVSGITGRYRGRLQIQKQEVEPLRGEEADLVHTARITPVHPATEGVTSRTIRELVHRALEELAELEDPLPPEVVEAESLSGFDPAMRAIHFPEDDSQLAAAQERLKFDELYTLELGVAFRKHRIETERRGVAHGPGSPYPERLLETLRFEPTSAQIRAIEQISRAMAEPRPMNVLLQGDVGAGKTLVALHAALISIGSGHQAAIMAPTEVLAMQHFRSVSDLLSGVGAAGFPGDDGRAASGQTSLLEPAEPQDTSGGPADAVRFALLTGTTSGKERAAIVRGIAEGSVDLVIGTHALVQETVSFADLSLAVIDEQHRFGLHQRSALKSKGVEPDVLIMTATPIPRTLALTYYGDLDVVILDEMPGGRLPIRTLAVRTPEERKEAEEHIREQVRAGHQAFVICAAIDEGNRAQVKAAEQEANRLSNTIFPDLKVSLLHGRMRPGEKEEAMGRFVAGSADILIATTVVEVGVDIPNATVMLVENAERFGIAQLHQLRGRVGRSGYPSTCFLVDGGSRDNPDAAERIEALVRTGDGFELADEDLRLRGEGTLFDVRQSGMPDLKLARLSEDLDLVKRARSRAFATIEADPSLERHPRLLGLLERGFAGSIDWLFRS